MPRRNRGKNLHDSNTLEDWPCRGGRSARRGRRVAESASGSAATTEWEWGRLPCRVGGAAGLGETEWWVDADHAASRAWLCGQRGEPLPSAQIAGTDFGCSHPLCAVHFEEIGCWCCRVHGLSCSGCDGVGWEGYMQARGLREDAATGGYFSRAEFAAYYSRAVGSDGAAEWHRAAAPPLPLSYVERGYAGRAELAAVDSAPSPIAEDFAEEFVENDQLCSARYQLRAVHEELELLAIDQATFSGRHDDEGGGDEAGGVGSAARLPAVPLPAAPRWSPSDSSGCTMDQFIAACGGADPEVGLPLTPMKSAVAAEPMQLLTLGGDAFAVHGWLDTPDVKRLAAAQHPELGSPSGFELLLGPTGGGELSSTVSTVSAAAKGAMLRGHLPLDLLLVWNGD